jgi:hypothetical protein
MKRGEIPKPKPTRWVKTIVIVGAILQFSIWNAATASLWEEPEPATTTSTNTPTTGPTTTPADPDSTPADPDSALYAARELKIAKSRPSGYSRDEFGQRWTDTDRNGCDQQNDVLRRDLAKRHTKPGTNGCVLAKGVLKSSSYSGDKIKWQKGDTTIEIDHVVSLADAWAMGAHDWSARKREKFANDPLNLEAVDADENQEKGDENAVDYRPEEVDAECWFLARQVSIKTKYRLRVAEDEKALLVDRLGSEDCIGGYRELETSKDYKFPKPKPIGEPKPKPKPKPTPEPESESDEPSEPSVRKGVHPGAFCSPAGRLGMTNRGTPMVCKGPGQPRWRAR